MLVNSKKVPNENNPINQDLSELGFCFSLFDISPVSPLFGILHNNKNVYVYVFQSET